MALTFTTLTSGEDGDGGASSATASFTPAANSLILVAVSTGLTGAAAAPSSLSGHSLTWTPRGNATISNGNLNIALYSAQAGASPSADNLDINYSGITPTNCIWEVVQVSGHDTSAPIAQTKQRGGTGFSFENPSLTFDAAVKATSGIFGAFAKNNQTAVGTTGGGYTKIGTGHNDGTPSNQIFAQYDAQAGAGHDGVFDMSWDSASGVAIAAVEINEAAPDPGGPSTITATHLDSGSSTTDGTSFNTVDSISPGANRLVLAFVATGDTSGAGAAPTGVSGAGLTFTRVGGQQQGSGNQRVDIFRAMSASPSSGPLTISYAATTENCGWVIAEFDGVDTSGTNGSGAIVQFKGGIDSGSNVAVALDNAVTSGNATAGCVTGNTQSPTYTAGSGFVLLGTGWDMSSPSNKGAVEWDVDGASTIAFTNAGTPLCALAAVEIKRAANEPHHGQAHLGGAAGLSAEHEFVHGPIVIGADSPGLGSLQAQAEVRGARLAGLGGLTAEATPPTAISVLTGTGTVTADGAVSPGVPLGIMYGWHQSGNDISELRDIEKALNKNFACVRMFEGTFLDSSEPNDALPSENAIDVTRDHDGRLLLWSVKARNWRAIWESSAADDFIDACGARLQEVGHDQVIFIFYHEPHENRDSPNRQSEDWVKAVKYIRNRWHQKGNMLYGDGNGKILIGYCGIRSRLLNSSQQHVDPIWLSDPTTMDEIIDVLCHDSYNQIVECPNKANRLFGHESNDNESWHALLQLADELEKPIVIGEWGSFAAAALEGKDIEVPTDDGIEKPCDACGFHDDLKDRLAATGPDQLDGGPYSPDRNGWFEQAAYFMKNNPLAKKWLKGFCYYHGRRWMFVNQDGTGAHPNGCASDPTNTGGVEGRTGWINAFVNDDYFTYNPFDPLSSSPITPPPVDPPDSPVTSCAAEDWNVVAQVPDGIPSTLNQVSGLAASPTLPGFWCVRDDTAESIFYMTETSPGSGTFTATEVKLTGTNVHNGDWEDVAVSREDGRNYIYIHSNRHNQNMVDPKRLYLVEEPSTPGSPSSIPVIYVGYWQFPNNLEGPTCPPDEGYYNCEGIDVYNGRLYAVRKRSGGFAEVFDFGPANSLSPDPNNPSAGVKLGTIAHSCPSTLALSTNGKSLLTISHGKAKIWRARAGSGMEACLDGKNRLVKEIDLPKLDADSANTEAGDWWPYNTCSFVALSESRNTYVFEDADPPAEEGEDVALAFANFDSATKSVYTTESFTPEANTNYTLFVVNGKTAGGGDKPSTVSGAGLTWTEKFDATVQANQKITLYQGISASPSTGAITVTFSASQDACLWFVVKTPGRELVIDVEQAGGTGTLNPTTGAITALEADCIPWVFCSINSTSGTVEPGAAFTKLGDSVSASSPSLKASLGYTLDDTQTPGTAVLDSTGRTYKILASAWVPV
ncbi:MAG TPA: hypothetical protein VHL09_16705 [Dehalococcoidia bacterium]|nr:hypothetical protein [Dehalococcoidia bacterium]